LVIWTSGAASRVRYSVAMSYSGPATANAKKWRRGAQRQLTGGAPHHWRAMRPRRGSPSGRSVVRSAGVSWSHSFHHAPAQERTAAAAAAKMRPHEPHAHRGSNSRTTPEARRLGACFDPHFGAQKWGARSGGCRASLPLFSRCLTMNDSNSIRNLKPAPQDARPCRNLKPTRQDSAAPAAAESRVRSELVASCLGGFGLAALPKTALR